MSNTQNMREIIKANDFAEKEKVFECVINKSATLLVVAKDKEHAYSEACAVLDGDTTNHSCYMRMSLNYRQSC